MQEKGKCDSCDEVYEHPKLSVVVLVRYYGEEAIPLLASLVRSDIPRRYEVVVIGPDEQVNFEGDIPKTAILPFDHWASRWKGVAQTSGDYVLMVDTDITAPARWFKRFLDVFEEDPTLVRLVPRVIQNYPVQWENYLSPGAGHRVLGKGDYLFDGFMFMKGPWVRNQWVPAQPTTTTEDSTGWKGAIVDVDVRHKSVSPLSEMQLHALLKK